MIRNLLSVVLLSLLIPAFGANEILPDSKKINETAFTQNFGQIVNEQGEKVPDVLAKASVPGMDLYITKTGVTYVLLQYEEDLDAKPHPVYFNEKKYKIRYSRIDVELSGASLSNTQMQFTAEAGWKSNYYKSSDGKGQENVSHYKTLTIQNVYPGIDWVWKYNKEDKLEYDFIVHPGGDAGMIKMKYNYGDIKAANNQLIISAKNGSLTEGPLQALCDNQAINIDYQFNTELKEITFKTGEHDLSKDLLIDPPLSLSWSAQFGGSFQNGLRGVTTDLYGNIYITGYTTSANFPTYNPGGIGYWDGTYNGQSDAIIMALDTAQRLWWATFLGGPGSDFGNSIAVDLYANNIYVTGGAQAGFPIVYNGNYYNQNTCTGQDAFIATFDGNLRLTWSTFYGGNGTDEGLKIYATKIPWFSNYFYVTGYTNSTGGTFHTHNALGGYYQTSVTGNEAFILKFYPNQHNLWATVYGGSGDDYATSIAEDSLGKIAVTGFTTSTNFPVAPGGGYYQSANAGGADGFVLQFDTSNSRLSATYYGGRGDDYFTDVAAGNTGSFEFTGRTNSTNFPIDSAPGFAYNQTHIADSTSSDAFIVKCLNDMSLSWATYYGGKGMDAGTGIATDNTGRMYVSGFTFSTDFPVDSFPGAFYQPTNHGNSDGFLARFSNQGVRSWSTYKGDSCFEYPNDIAYDNHFNKFYVAGEGLLACVGGNGQSIPDTGQVNNGVSSIGFCWGFNGQNNPPNCLSLQLTKAYTACPGQCNGFGQISLAGGTLPYQVVWSNEPITITTDSIVIDSTLCGDLNWVEASDAGGCKAEATFVSGPLTITLDEVGITCLPGYVTANANGGNGVDSFYWSVNGVAYGGYGYNYSSTYGIFQPTTVYVTVTDQRGCKVSDSTMETYDNANNQYYIDVLRFPTCINGGIVSLAGGLWPNVPNVSWSDGFNTFYGDTLYNVFANTLYYGTDNSDCVNGQGITFTFSISDDLSFLQITSHNSTNCNTPNGDIYIFDPGNGPSYVTNDSGLYGPAGYPLTDQFSYTNKTYQWSTGTTYTSNNLPNSINGLLPGSYTVTITDADGCSTVLSAIITGPAPPQIGVSNITYPCPGQCNGSAQVNISGGNSPYHILWSDGNTTNIDNQLCTGNYRLTVTDALNCIKADSILITPSSAIIITDTISPIQCYGGTATITITASGGTAPYTGTGNFNQAAGNYVLTVTDANGCKDSIAGSVSQPTPLSIGLQIGEPSCGTDTVTVTATGGTSPYTGTGNIAYSHGGTYTITVTDNNGCSVDSIVTVMVDTCLTGTSAGLKQGTGISVYPNPATDQFFVQLDKPSDTGGEIKLFTTEGKLVLLNIIEPAESLKQIDCGKLASALYVLKVSFEQRDYYYKVVVDR